MTNVIGSYDIKLNATRETIESPHIVGLETQIILKKN